METVFHDECVDQAQLCLFMPEINRPQCAWPSPSKGNSC